MVAFSGPLAMERCKPRQARKGATVADASCAEVWLEKVHLQQGYLSQEPPVMNWSKRTPGFSSAFTLVEMLVVLMIIAILATLAIPDQTPRYTKLQIEEVLKYSEDIKPKIKDYYSATSTFPASNADANLPASDKLVNTLIKQTTIENGAIHFTLGTNANGALQNKTLTLQPLVVSGSATSPIDWTCGFSAVPTGMEAKGENKTNIEAMYLPLKCYTAHTQ